VNLAAADQATLLTCSLPLAFRCNAEESRMRKLLLSTLVSLGCVAPVMAEEAPQRAVSPVPPDLATPAPSPSQQQKDTQSIEAIEEGLRTRLARAGFTDIEMVPTSFLVRAKEAAGNAVMLVVSPDSVAELKQAPPQDGEDDTTGMATPPGGEKF